MADRTVRVRLEALTSAYKRAMEDAAASTQRLVDRAGGLEQLGGKMQRVGGALTVGLTLPLAAAGGAAVKMATDFETSFASLVGLAGVPQAEVEGLKQSVLDLAGETGRAPQELAEALYFAASAGLDAAGAMDAVTVAAKGAAAGLGNTTDIVGLVASAVASYGEANITAAEAVDILTATIREGRADPDELAGTLGRILPIASQLGVEFDEVGGTVAYLSNVFGDTNRTVTATQGLLVKLLSPSKQGRDALDDMGTSVEELHEAISERGLLGALDLLRERGFAQNQQKLAELFDDIEGRQAALALLADKSGQLADTLGAVGDSAGAADEAFAVMAETAGFKNTQAFAQLQTALIQVGDVLVPLVADVAAFAGKLLELFNGLPGPAQTALVALGGLLAVTGPLTSIAGKMVSNWHTLGRGFDKAATGAYDLAGGMGKIARAGAVVGILYGVGQALDATVNRLERADLNGLQRALLDLTDTGNVDAFTEQFGGLADAIERVAAPSIATQAGHAINEISTLGGLLGRGVEGLDQAKATIDDLDDALASLAATDPDAAAAALRAIQDSLSPEAADRLPGLLDGYKSALDGLDVAGRTAAGGIDEAGAATEDLIPPVDEATAAQEALEDAIKGVTNALRAQFDPFFAATDAMLSNEEAQRKVEEAHWDVTKASDDLAAAIKREGKESWAAKDAAYKLDQAQRNLTAAQRDAGRSALDVASSMTELKTRVEEGNIRLEDGADMLDQWAEQGLITKAQAEQLKTEMFYATLQAQELGKQNPTVTISADTQAFWAHMEAATAAVNAFNQTHGTAIPVYRGPGVELERKVGGPIPGALGQPVPILAHGGEYVLSADVVNAIKNGRPSAGLPGLASAGAGGSTSTNTRYGDTIVIHNPTPTAAEDSIRREQRRREMLAAM